MKGEGKGQTFVHTEQDRAVSREVDRGLPSLYLRQAAERLTPPLDMPLPATPTPHQQFQTLGRPQCQELWRG